MTKLRNMSPPHSRIKKIRGGDGEGFFGTDIGADKSPGFFSKMKGKLGSNNANLFVTLAVLVVIALIVIIIYIIYQVQKRNLKSVNILGSPRKLFDLDGDDQDFEDSKMVPTMNGQEFTYTFWLYLLDFDETTERPRMVFMRGSNAPELEGASPVVFMDGGTNRLYITITTNRTAEGDDGQIETLTHLLPGSNINKKVLTAVVEYVPLQRWVNITFTLQDNLLTVYQDGDMYTVKNVHDLWDKETSGERPAFSGTRGDLHLGPTENNSDLINGYLSGLKFYNYALMQNDAKSIYNAGPVTNGWLEKLGISRYGVQAPIYKIE